MGSAASSRSDTVRTSSYDQQYFLYTSGQPTGAIRYSLTGLFRHLQSGVSNGQTTWSTEARPAGSIHWSTPLLDLRGDAAYRSNQDEIGATNLTDRSGGIHAQTNLAQLPLVFGSVYWAKNVNDLDLIGYDTRTRTVSTGATYSRNHFFGNYSFSELKTLNTTANVNRSTDSHSGRLDYSISPVKHLVNLQTSYQITSRSEHDHSPATDQSLVIVPAIAGLYLDDPTPEFEALEAAPGLTDGLLEVAAQEDFDLVNGAYHNFGLDFGTAIEIDRLHLYIDTLATTSQAWTIWSSDDNLNWTRVSSDVTAEFNSVFLRYEFVFERITSRYAKLTVTPQLSNSPIRVTELRGLISRSTLAATQRTTDHRGSARVQLDPAKWLHAEFGGEAVRQDVSQVALAREEDILQSSLRIAPAEQADLMLRYQRNNTRYPDTNGDDGISSATGATLRSNWSRSVSTVASLERREEESGQTLERRGDYARVELSTLLFPALRGSSQFSYSEDERFSSRDKIFSRSMTHALDGEPTPRSQFGISYRYETYSAWVSVPRKYRISLNGRMSYRMTDTITLSSTGSASRDPQREDRAYDGFVSWTPTQKISLGGSFSRIEGDQSSNQTLYSLQAIFRWTARTELTGSLSFNDSEGNESVSSSRVSLFTRF